MDRKDEKYLKDSKKRFEDILRRKMQTTFIGALSEFEKKFGFLWGDKNYLGHLKNNTNLDAEIWKELWLEVRDRILTNGNHQLNSILSELEMYDLYWNRYRLNFTLGKDGYLHDTKKK